MTFLNCSALGMEWNDQYTSEKRMRFDADCASSATVPAGPASQKMHYYRYSNAEVSCWYKYLLFSYNIVFWRQIKDEDSIPSKHRHEVCATPQGETSAFL
ncbi:tetraspanin-14-like protein [Cricetulus griseus]|nr:tetraspanin-14-like protein [Cricetulus griseus]